MIKNTLIAIAIFSSFSSFAQIKIANHEVVKRIEKKKVQLVDVRTPEEYSKKHLKNSRNVNWNDKEFFASQIGKLNKKKPVYVYCLSGGRSNKAAQYLAEKGFDVYEIEGGIMPWEASKLPLVHLETKLSGLNLKDFNAIIKSHSIVLVDFYADWCAPCKEMSPIIDEIAKSYKESVKVLKIDADQNETLIRQLGVSGIPKFYIFKNGKETWSTTGITDQATIEKELK